MQKQKTFADVHLLQREYHNRNKFSVKFTRLKNQDLYVLAAGKALGPEIAILEPDGFLYLPHGFYLVEGLQKNGKTIPFGVPINLLINLEKAMFRGNKVPSNSYGLNE